MANNWIYDIDNFILESTPFEIEISPDSNAFPAISLIHIRSGLRIVVCKTPGPLCQLNIFVPTITYSDKGLPHTLEHRYLDALANKCISNGTNAYTAPDHTMYTFESAGEDGVINTLPVFLDGVFNPILSESQFITEVYHYDQFGKESGVVFSEMSSVENTDFELLNNELIKTLYGYNYPYYYNYGGLTSEIATLTNSEISQYHSRYYTPQRISVLLTGAFNMDLSRLLNAFTSHPHVFPQNITSYIGSPLSPLIPKYDQNPKISDVPFPSDSSDLGIIGFAWIGPRLTDTKSRLALTILFQYLTETSSSPLNQKFVELVDPIASYVDIELRDYEPSCIVMTFNGVPYNAKSNSSNKLFQDKFYYSELITCLRNLSSTTFNGDSNALYNTVKRFIIEFKLQIERNPIEEVNNILLSNLLSKFYSPTNQNPQTSIVNFEKNSKVFTKLNSLLSEPVEYWVALMNDYLINSNCVMVKLHPDTNLGEKITKQSLARSSALVSGMTESEKSNLASKIKSALDDNKINIPQDVISKLPEVPPTTSIPILPYSQKTYFLDFNYTPSSSEIPKDVSSKLPKKDLSFPFKFISVLESDTSFVHLKLCFALTGLNNQIKPFLPLFTSLFFNTNLLIPANTPFGSEPETSSETSERLIDYKVITSSLADVFVSHDISLANSSDRFSCYPPSEIISINAKIEPEKFDLSLRWLIQSIAFMENSITRVLSIAKNLLSQINESKRNGDYLINSISTKLSTLNTDSNSQFDSDANFNVLNFGSSIDLAVSIFTQEKLLKKVISVFEDYIKKNPDIIDDSASDSESDSELDSEYSSDHSCCSDSEIEPESDSNLAKSNTKHSFDKTQNSLSTTEVSNHENKKHKTANNLENRNEKNENLEDKYYAKLIDDLSVDTVLDSLDQIKLHMMKFFETKSEKVSDFTQIGIPRSSNISHKGYISKLVKNWQFFSLKLREKIDGKSFLKPSFADFSNSEFNCEIVTRFEDFRDNLNSKNQAIIPFPFPIKLRFPSNLNSNPKKNVHIPSPSLCSSYSIMITHCNELKTINSMGLNKSGSIVEIEDISLRVLSELLSRTDGLLYNVVRGKGYAYDCNVIFSPLKKNIYITCSDATDIKMAFISIGETLLELLENKEFWMKSINDFEISLAKSNILYGEYSSISSPSSLLSNCVFANLRGFLDIKEMNSWIQRNLESVTNESLRGVFEKYFTKFINKDQQSINIILTPPIEGTPKLPIIFEGNKFGWEFSLSDLSDF
ncbi:hypothetical protein AYI70_g5327 [Smittium culicis]|uniref:Peptidase M16 C-terminal domain-containing protein n=1 Tax=Smittium culicis TaxID=133412 RepID=A0A1R1XPQ3_9FUNG|nr:hypothetical protein AYI70_g6493 [Smittium culicis]OMJ18485.1 hypothetical protein AYI70_g5327 [Smittium culicis]